MCPVLGTCCEADNLLSGLVSTNCNTKSVCAKCYKSVINKVSKVKLILSRGKERAQRKGDTSEDPKATEAFWELEKGPMCIIGRGRRRAGCGVGKDCLRKGKWLMVAGYRVIEPHNKSVYMY